MQGSIDFMSEKDKGTQFRVYIPQIEVVDTPVIEKDFLINDYVFEFEQATILVVDDVESNINVLIGLLDKQKLNFIKASSGSEAIEILKKVSPDLILMDIRMGGLSGVETVKIIRKEERFQKTPIIAYTATIPNLINKDVNLFNAHLQKPANKSTLEQTLRQFLPYQQRSKITDSKKEAKLTHAQKVDLIKVNKNVEIELKPFYERIKDQLILSEISEFFIQLEKDFENTNIDFINDYIKSFKMALDSYDIEAIDNLLHKFPMVMEYTQNLSQEN
jgi:CheY-like chemotaxis protein